MPVGLESQSLPVPCLWPAARAVQSLWLEAWATPSHLEKPFDLRPVSARRVRGPGCCSKWSTHDMLMHICLSRLRGHAIFFNNPLGTSFCSMVGGTKLWYWRLCLFNLANCFQNFLLLLTPKFTTRWNGWFGCEFTYSTYGTCAIHVILVSDTYAIYIIYVPYNTTDIHDTHDTTDTYYVYICIWNVQLTESFYVQCMIIKRTRPCSSSELAFSMPWTVISGTCRSAVPVNTCQGPCCQTSRGRMEGKAWGDLSKHNLICNLYLIHM
jgi:hypothetical protein